MILKLDYEVLDDDGSSIHRGHLQDIVDMPAPESPAPSVSNKPQNLKGVICPQCGKDFILRFDTGN